MRYVILRDDDTNAVTPVDCLERLYRPFFDYGLPVNLAVIPWVRTDAKTLDGHPEGFLLDQATAAPKTVPIGHNDELLSYLRERPGFHVVQHGCHHDPAEFDRTDREDIARRLGQGASLLSTAGLGIPLTFVAPHDRLSAAAYDEAAQRYRVISTGWFEWRRLPVSWRPAYLWHKLRKRRHWQHGNTLLLSHPGCLLSCQKPYETMLESVQQAVLGGGLTVIVTHWWEYFRHGRRDQAFINILHQTAEWLALEPDVRVIRFSDLIGGGRRFDERHLDLAGDGGELAGATAPALAQS
jgi:hypothetical protein